MEGLRRILRNELVASKLSSHAWVVIRLVIS